GALVGIDELQEDAEAAERVAFIRAQDDPQRGVGADREVERVDVGHAGFLVGLRRIDHAAYGLAVAGGEGDAGRLGHAGLGDQRVVGGVGRFFVVSAAQIGVGAAVGGGTGVGDDDAVVVAAAGDESASTEEQ